MNMWQTMRCSIQQTRIENKIMKHEEQEESECKGPYGYQCVLLNFESFCLTNEYRRQENACLFK